MPVDREKSNLLNEVTRRKFIGVAAGTAAAMLIKPSLVRGTAANSAIRVGLLGCGGRGTEDASNLVDTGGARVVAHDFEFSAWTPVKIEDIDDDGEGRSHRLYLYRR